MENNHTSKDIPLKFIDELRAIGFTPEEEQKLRNSLVWCTYKKGYVIDRQNEIMQRHIYVVSGAARSYYINDGKEYNYSFYFDGQFIIPPRSLSKNDTTIFVQFLTKTDVCYMPAPHKNKYPILSTAKFQQLVNIGLVHLIKELEENVLMLRMDAKDRYNWVIRHYPRILDVVSITQLASYLNITKETLYRIRSGKY